ncbi:MAG TPA: T9SS type A sorting domain-containing protein [Bacteroidia bacterium]|jgi:hypothetical protein
MKECLLLAVFLFSSSFSFGQTAGPNNPAMGTCVPGSACLACPGSVWNSPANVIAQDNSLATCVLTPNGQCFQSNCFYSRYLYASNFGFNIPTGATIDGVTVDIYRAPGNVNSVADSSVRLVQNNLPAGMNKAMAGTWPQTAAYYTYGSASDTWGLILTPADINDMNFGVYLRIYNVNNNTLTPFVDHIRITVDYTSTTGIHDSQTSFASQFNAFANGNELELSFTMLQQGAVNFKVFDITGKEVWSRYYSQLQEGNHTEKVKLNGAAEGIYFVQMQSGSSLITKKFVLRD